MQVRINKVPVKGLTAGGFVVQRRRGINVHPDARWMNCETIFEIMTSTNFCLKFAVMLTQLFSRDDIIFYAIIGNVIT